MKMKMKRAFLTSFNPKIKFWLLTPMGKYYIMFSYHQSIINKKYFEQDYELVTEKELYSKITVHKFCCSNSVFD